MSLVNRVFALLALIAFALTDEKEMIRADVRRWAELEGREYRMPGTMLDLLVMRPEFRTLMDYRLEQGNAAGRAAGGLAFVFLRRRVALYLSGPEIGPGLYIQHGFATGVDAEYIGANVWINQQVTIGHGVGKDGVARTPRIEDGATIYVGAKVLGGVRVGRNAVVGANAVVIKDVPDNALAVGVPARIIERPPGE
jgi:serine O-acetyltransferase